MVHFDLAEDVDHYAVLGDPIAHSWSPQIHHAFAAQFSQRIHYQAIQTSPADLAATITAFAAAGGKGINITVPLKQQAFTLLNKVSARGQLARAVNTVSLAIDKQKWQADNTDGEGLLRDLMTQHKQLIYGQRILLLGAGGAAWGIVGALLSAIPACLVIYNRTASRAEELALAFSGSGNIFACQQLDSMAPFDLIINATSASLHGAQLELPDTILAANTFCYDLVYAAADTPFLLWARSRGITQLADGLGMLVEQAAAAYQIWRNVRPDTPLVIALIKERLLQQEK